MILCIPSVGQRVRVLDGQQWTFRLYSEYRNYDAWEYFAAGQGLPKRQMTTWYDDFVPDTSEAYRAVCAMGETPERKHLPVTLDGGSVLTIDRIYLRKGKKDFDSITFILNNAKIPGKKGANARVRFWVRLDEVNAGNLEILR